VGRGCQLWALQAGLWLELGLGLGLSLGWSGLRLWPACGGSYGRVAASRPWCTLGLAFASSSAGAGGAGDWLGCLGLAAGAGRACQLWRFAAGLWPLLGLGLWGSLATRLAGSHRPLWRRAWLGG
jgi:hypothetical protein